MRHTSGVHEVQQCVERGSGHLRRAADLIKVDDITNTPVAVVEYLLAEPRAVTRHHSAVSAEGGTSTSAVTASHLAAVSDATCTRYL